jgi:hypothetical protein
MSIEFLCSFLKNQTSVVQLCPLEKIANNDENPLLYLAFNMKNKLIAKLAP